MTSAELQKMKDTPGLHTIAFSDDGSVLVVASIGGKLYAMSPDQALNDEGWHPAAQLERCLFVGTVTTVGQKLMTRGRGNYPYES